MDIVKIIAKGFKDKGFEIYEVGGCVRDSLLDKRLTDIDLATDAPPEEIKKILEGFGHVYTIGEKYGTIGLSYGTWIIEATTYRGKVYPTDSRKPDVTFGNSLIEDLSRRDFTINALARDPIDGTIIDLFEGNKDLNRRVIRCVGKDEDRFNEDPLRMMRAIRFACQLGFSVNVKISDAKRLEIVSKERIHDELVKIITSPNPVFGIVFLCETGLMDYIIPDFMKLKNINQGHYHVKDAFEHSLEVFDKCTEMDYRENNLIFRLAGLLHDIAKPETKRIDKTGVHFYNHHNVGAVKARAILECLKFRTDIIDKVDTLIKFHMAPVMLERVYNEGKLKKKMAMRLVRKVGEEDILMLLGLVTCDLTTTVCPRYQFLKSLEDMIIECLSEKPDSMTSPLSGNDIIEIFGLEPSRIVGDIKRYLTGLVVDGVLKAGDKEKAIEFAKLKMSKMEAEEIEKDITETGEEIDIWNDC